MSETMTPTLEAAAPIEPEVPVAVEAPVVAAPEAAPAAPAEPVVAEPAFTPHTDTPSLMQEAGKVEPPAPPAVEAVTPEPPAAPVYEPFTLPDGLSLEAEKLSGYTGILGKHAIPQAVGQELLDLYIAERQRDAVQVVAQQHQAFADMRRGWAESARNDPELGGANFNTTMDAVATVRDRFIPQQGPVREAFDKFLTSTGAGDHPEFLRFVARIGAALREPAPPPPSVNAKPPPDIGKRPSGRNGMAPIYEHPSSPQPRAIN